MAGLAGHDRPFDELFQACVGGGVLR
jgi:hypothetical protein